MSDAPPPGWYADPIDSTRLRYWDGSRWSDDVRDVTPQPPLESPAAGPWGSAPPSGQVGAGTWGDSTHAAQSQADHAPTGSSPRKRVALAAIGGLVALILIGGLLALALSGGSSGDGEDAASISQSDEEQPDQPDKDTVQQGYDKAVSEACAQLKADITPERTQPAIDYDWDATYEEVLGVTRSQMVAKIRACAQPAVDAALEQKRAADEAAAAAEAQRQAEAAAAEQAAIDNAPPADVDTIVKNPDAVKGQVFKLVAVITQMDAATGPCIFRGYWDKTVRAYNFEYQGDNAMFSSTPTITATTDCPIFDGIDQDDTMTLTVRGQGSYSYDTQIGGNTTVPLFQVLRVDKVVKG